MQKSWIACDANALQHISLLVRSNRSEDAHQDDDLLSSSRDALLGLARLVGVRDAEPDGMVTLPVHDATRVRLAEADTS